tara:strand:- start:1491 stop:2540 length:1050 start_codon:yes stop_codon:yes gene_type:complete
MNIYEGRTKFKYYDKYGNFDKAFTDEVWDNIMDVNVNLEMNIHEWRTKFKYYDKYGSFDLAFSCLDKANKLRRATFPLEIIDRIDVEVVKKLKNSFPIDVSDYQDNNQIVPIFIVGMPRSGTSITEQIICGHSKVIGCGELSFLEQEVLKITSLVFDKEAIIINRREQIHDVLKTIRSNYLLKIKSLAKGNRYITDKMPLNFRWIGFIKSCLPEAKIVFCKRNFMDVCWSIYKQDWEEAGNEFSYSLVDIGNFYNRHIDLIKYWEKIYPDSIYTMHHKKLVSDSRSTINSLFEYLEIPVEDLCFTPHLNNREVNTVSKSQVKNPIYKRKTPEWLPYKTHLKPLLELAHV